MRAAINTLIATIAMATPAFAANGAQDKPGLLVWGFLAFCAIAVVGQMAPAILLMVGAVKGFVAAPAK
jgi:hypothetical protein